MSSDVSNAQTESFINRWQNAGARERSNAQLFLNELCDLLDVPHPDPAGDANAYDFERDVTFQKVDGSVGPGRIDLYKRDGFLLEAKQGSEADGEKIGDGYTDTLRAVHNDIGESNDFVIYWWNHAADLARRGQKRTAGVPPAATSDDTGNGVRAFGFVTTNSLRQTFNRRVIQKYLDHKNPLSITFAIPDHPWVDDGAAIRIAMTTGTAGDTHGLLQRAIEENRSDSDSYDVQLETQTGKIAADLTIGADVASAMQLLSNGKLSSRGYTLGGKGFVLSENDQKRFTDKSLIKRFIGSRDLAVE